MFSCYFSCPGSDFKNQSGYWSTGSRWATRSRWTSD